MVLIHFSKNDCVLLTSHELKFPQFCLKFSQSLSKLTVVSVSSIRAEILKMPFLSAGKTDFAVAVISAMISFFV